MHCTTCITCTCTVNSLCIYRYIPLIDPGNIIWVHVPPAHSGQSSNTGGPTSSNTGDSTSANVVDPASANIGDSSSANTGDPTSANTGDSASSSVNRQPTSNFTLANNLLDPASSSSSNTQSTSHASSLMSSCTRAGQY